MFIQVCMPMMADVISGAVPRPIELMKNEPITTRWTAACPAWRKLNLPALEQVGVVADNEGVIKPEFGYIVFRTVADLRDFLGERGPAILYNGVVLVFNSDGTRVAVEHLPIPVCVRPMPDADELITITEAAEMLGVTVQAISNRIRSGSLLAYDDAREPNPQRRKRVLRQDIEQIRVAK